MSIPYGRGNAVLIELLAKYGTVEEENKFGQFGNLLNFSIVRWLQPKQNSKLMQTAKTAVSDAETLMGQALPTDFVGILVSDLPGAAAANNGISIQADAGFDGRYSDRIRQRVIAHEIGHYWWTGKAPYTSAGFPKERPTISAPTPYGVSSTTTTYRRTHTRALTTAPSSTCALTIHSTAPTAALVTTRWEDGCSLTLTAA